MIRLCIGFDPFLAEPLYQLFSGLNRNTRRIHRSVTAMLDKVIFSRFRSAAGRFAGDNQGNIALLFGIAAVPILTFVGAAIDYSRANSARTAMQAALDSTAAASNNARESSCRRVAGGGTLLAQNFRYSFSDSSSGLLK